MKKLLILFVLLVFLSSLKAQTFWKKTSFSDLISVSILSIHPNGYIYAGTKSNNGTFISKDNGQSWERMNIDTTLQINSFYFKDSVVFICSTNGLYKSSNYGQNWELFAFENMHICSVIFNKPNDILVSYFENDNNSYGFVSKSTNNGYSWVNTEQDQVFTRLIYIYSIEQFNGEIILLRNQAINWQNLISIGNSLDSGKTWKYSSHWWTMAEETLNNNSISSNGNILLHSNKHNNLLIWNKSNNQLDSMNIDTIANGVGINASVFSKDDHLFLGINSNQDGVFRSTDLGLSWTELYEGLDHSTVYTLAIDSSGILYAGTDKGIYRSLETVVNKKEPEKSSNEFTIIPNPIINYFEINFNLDKPQNVSLSLMDLLGNITVLKENEFYNSGKNSIIIDKFNLNTGIYFIYLETFEGVKVKKAIIIK